MNKSPRDTGAKGEGTMYVCTKCRTARQFGFGLPDDALHEPPLHCSRCGTITRHQFSRLAPMVGLRLPYGETKWVLEADAVAGALQEI